MKLHILGAGCPDATPTRYGSAFLLEIGDEMLMVDCGPAATFKMAKMGIRPTQIDRLFFTHHHFDHNVDFPCFVLTRWDQTTKRQPLHVLGPPPTEQFVERLLGENGAFVEDWKARIEHPASHMCHQWRGGDLPRPAPAVEAKNIDRGPVLETDHWKLTAERVHHCEPWLQNLAYRFDTDEGSIVFAGDCGDCPEIRAFAKDADTIVMACTHFGKTERNAAVVDVITGTPEVAAIGNEAGIKRLVLTHTSPNYLRPGQIELAVADIARRYDGEIQFPDELDTLPL